jgi:hypothetical protein
MNIGFGWEARLLSIERARQLRKNMPIPEAKLWNALRMLRSQARATKCCECPTGRSCITSTAS